MFDLLFFKCIKYILGPLYKVVSRQGTLSTTGHSTNFILFLEIPTKDNADVWVKAGVAVFTSLRY